MVTHAGHDIFTTLVFKLCKINISFSIITHLVTNKVCFVAKIIKISTASLIINVFYIYITKHSLCYISQHALVFVSFRNHHNQHFADTIFRVVLEHHFVRYVHHLKHVTVSRILLLLRHTCRSCCQVSFCLSICLIRVDW